MASIRKKNNSYEIRVSCGYDVKGKQKTQQMTWRPEPGMTEKQIEKEVQKQAVLFEENCHSGQVTANIKFQSFAEQWFNEYAKLNLRTSSYNRMRYATKRVYSAIGHLRLDRITGRDIQKFITDLLTTEQNMNTGGNLSHNTVMLYFHFISDVFSYAVKMGMIDSNPCQKVSIPKAEAKVKAIYTLEEVEQLMKLLETAPLKYRLFYTMALYTGFRRGELMGLEWKDIDWNNNVISIRRTSNYSKEKGTYTDKTKTKRSQRSGRYSQLVFDLLKEYKAEQDEEREKLGDQWVDTDRIFVTANGAPMNPGTPYTWLRTFCQKNNMRFCDIHSFRHLHASLLINAGVDVATVSADLGHSGSNVTLRTYVHEFQEAQARASKVIEDTLNFKDKGRAAAV